MTKARLEIRAAAPSDVRAIAALARRVYEDFAPYTASEIRGQINNFPEGCFVAVLDGKVIGYCATMRIGGDKALAPHSWDEITGNGYGSRHDPTGDFLMVTRCASIPRCAARGLAGGFTRSAESSPSARS